MRGLVVAGINQQSSLIRCNVFGRRADRGCAPATIRIMSAAKVRTQRRHGMPILNPIAFYPWRAYDAINVAVQWLRRASRYRRILRRVVADPGTYTYFDQAMQPAAGDGVDRFVEVFAERFHGFMAHRHPAPLKPFSSL